MVLIKKYFINQFHLEGTMKTLIAIFGVLLILSFIGCRENQVSQPETIVNMGLNKVTTGEVKIHSEVIDPVFGACIISGKTSYMMDIPEYSANANAGIQVKLSLELDAELCTRLMSPIKFSIRGVSVEVVNIREEEIQFVEKNYEISNRPDVRLGVKYLVTTSGVEIQKMVLLQIDY